MKKLFSIVMIAVLTISLAACGGEPTQAPSERDLPSESEPSSSASSFAPPKTYTVEEAAELNAEISASDVRLVQFEAPKSGSPTATIKTSAGDISVVLYPDQAPKAVENFLTHAKNGYYNGLDFYKAIEDFIIQSGAPDGAQPESIYKEADDASPGYFESEFSLDLWNFRGALTMANKGADRPDTNTSEFFIVQADVIGNAMLGQMEEIGFPEKVIEKYREVGGIPGFDWHNTVFGMVTDGMDIVDEIAAAEETVIINSIIIKE